MFLKALTIKGFKSFADSTTLAMEPGVTVVVGPNGSGKSNVVDAIGWVLGAQAPSSVRSQKMEDVIFAGTAKRPALGRAEVALTIDNSAGLLDIEFSEVTITRTLFRSGDSEYAINGVPCRLLDIQELLSDSGVGRQQHVIISQGQIDAVLNARPEDRRLIIEEAAGVLKFRRRKEKAERRLASTEANLTRLQDLLREVRRQLRPLEKQADAARRHGEVVAELQALQVWLAGQDLTRLRQRLAAGERTRQEVAEHDRSLRQRLAELDTQVMATEARLSALGGDDLGDALARFEGLRERARGLGAVLAERSRGLQRDLGASVDEAVIASLESEAAALAADLAAADAEAETFGPEALDLQAAEARLEEARLAFQTEWAAVEDLAPSGRAAEVRGELGARRAGVERAESEAERARARIAQLEERATRLAEESARLAEVVAEAERLAPTLAAQAEQAEAARRRAVLAAEQADESQRAADAEHHSWTARADALALALDEARARAGAERLAAVEGVVGTVLDLVRVDEGYEAAFEAAVGEALAAVVVGDASAGRRALEVLAAGGEPGAVLPLGATLPVVNPPAVGEPVRAHVRGLQPGVDALLDGLVGGAVVVGSWPAALDAALAHPGAVVVTEDGDRFGPSGWRVGAGGSGATGAAAEEARQRAQAAAEQAKAAAERASAARVALEAARRAEREASRAVDQQASRAAGAAESLRRIEGDRTDVAQEAEGLRAHLAEVDERVGRDRARVDDLARALPALEAEEAEATARGRAVAEARRALEEQAAEVGGRRSDLEIRSAAVEERRALLRRRLAEVEERLSRNVAERREAEARRVELEARATGTERLHAIVVDRLAVVEAEVADLRERRRRQSETARAVAAELDGLRKERAESERLLGEQRERLSRAEIDEAEVRMRLEGVVEALRRDHQVEPDVAMAAPAPDLAEGATPAARARELERDLRLMGPINPLALEEYAALQERNEFLEGQLEDVRSTRRELAKVIKAVDEEIVNVFGAAFADVSQNFTDLFDMLFPGGQGRLTLTMPDNPLETGIEIEAKPSGKNVKKLSLLSGGERSLTALAYLFAVFRARPSPFYVMDEVEAALDDVNLHRFLGLVSEFRQEAQLIIVSHQKRTMEAADCLYGVTMQPGGSSKVVSEKAS